jgi:type I restriction enzyme M protein
MIKEDNLKTLLLALKFEQNGNQYSKTFAHSEAVLTVDFDKNCLIYPEDQGLTIHERQTCNFSANENFVVFECVHRLLEKGYKPEHIELEPKWKVGHGASGGRADILVKDNQGNPLLIIECNTPGNEYNKAWKNTELHGDQLFSYAQQIPDTQFLCLYTADYTETSGVSKLSHIISHKDNPKVLEEGKNLKAFKDGGDSKNRFTVWRDTYKKEYTTQGIFEPNIQPYFIGKDKYTQDDLNSIDAKDKEGKYHKFRTILRKHNVSGRENAFDVLVNLFLCKIVDESENTTDLKFYWKGIAYDSYFDLIDRLQALYKIGMGRYLDQDIVYISNDQIENAFWAVKQKRNATKNTIKDYFRQLKFFTNNDFGFIDVHNEALFYQNAKVLLEVVQMWQDLRLKDQEQNQFLGDMFEYFLDQGIKQSEGQFFTPMPICKFILMSLPLEAIIKDSIQAPKAIDYACGAGHFLNELAAQLKPFIKQYKQTDPKAFFKEIIGIEKEYRLSKVAKVAAFMYGQEGIEILHHDALDQHPKVQKGSFNILVANPPFAVEGFLETLPEEQRDQYALTQTVTDVANNRNIQCFFIERAQQLLERGGVAGIIVPSSVLSNSDSTHIGSREILLQAFDIVALVELGNGTFGKTGTNTVVLFIRRKRQLPEPAEHFKNRVEDWFENDNDEDMETYQDLHLIKKYCQHIAIPFEHYQTLLHGTPSADLLAHELFLDYKKDFDQSGDIKKLATQKFFKGYDSEQKQAELDKRYLAYLQKIEKDKLFYFVLAYNNPQKVLIVKSPSDNKEQKQFLGYEWSAAKGNEGLKMTTTAQGNHLTPLYDPEDRYNPEKINALIQDNFSGNTVVIPETLESYASLVSLVDLLDFSRKDFDKHINLSVKKNISIDSKWESVKIANLNTLLKRGKSTKYGHSNIQVIKSGQARGFKEFNFTEKYFTTDNFQSDERNLQKGDLLINSTGVGTAGRVTLFELEGNFVADSHITIFRPNEKILSEYALQCFAHIGFKTIERMAQGLSGQIELTIPTISEIQIPVPPLETQTQIVQAFEAIDAEVIAAQTSMEQAKKEVNTKLEIISKQNYPLKKLSNLIEIIGGGTPDTKKSEYWNGGIPWLSVADFNTGKRFVSSSEKTISELGLNNSSTKYLQVGDLIISARGTVGVVAQLAIPMTFNQSCYGLRGLEEVDNGYLYYVLKREVAQFKDNAYGSTFGSITTKTFDSIKIAVPPIDVQLSIVTEIEQIETKITAAQQIIDAAASKKQAILKQYL